MVAQTLRLVITMLLQPIPLFLLLLFLRLLVDPAIVVVGLAVIVTVMVLVQPITVVVIELVKVAPVGQYMALGVMILDVLLGVMVTLVAERFRQLQPILPGQLQPQPTKIFAVILKILQGEELVG